MRSVKHGKKRSRRVNYNRNAKIAKNKAVKKRKAMHGLMCKEMKVEWDKKATVKKNVEAMGLAYNVNKISAFASAASTENDMMEIDEPKKMTPVKARRSDLANEKFQSKSGIDPEKASRVIAALEKEVQEEEARLQKNRRYRLSRQDIEFCVYMMEKHGADFEEMSRDPKNLYQDTPKQIQRKLRIFKESPEYVKYELLKAKMV